MTELQKMQQVSEKIKTAISLLSEIERVEFFRGFRLNFKYEFYKAFYCLAGLETELDVYIEIKGKEKK